MKIIRKETKGTISASATTTERRWAIRVGHDGFCHPQLDRGFWMADQVGHDELYHRDMGVYMQYTLIEQNIGNNYDQFSEKTIEQYYHAIKKGKIIRNTYTTSCQAK